jgi:hypothetical protein
MKGFSEVGKYMGAPVTEKRYLFYRYFIVCLVINTFVIYGCCKVAVCILCCSIFVHMYLICIAI